MRKNQSVIKKVHTILDRIESSPEDANFVRILRWEIAFFDRLRKAARFNGPDGIKKMFYGEVSPYAVSGWDIVGGGEERWIKYFWGLLYPEDFVWNPKSVGGQVIFWWLKDEGRIGDREIQIVYGMLTSISGITFFFDREMKRFRGMFGDRPSWPEEMKRGMEVLLGNLSFCPPLSCGKFFLANRKGQRFCSDACRKKAHDVPSVKRKDSQTVRAFFRRKINEGYSREDAWDKTKKQHGVVLTELGLDGPHPPKSWAQEKEK